MGRPWLSEEGAYSRARRLACSSGTGRVAQPTERRPGAARTALARWAQRSPRRLGRACPGQSRPSGAGGRSGITHTHVSLVCSSERVLASRHGPGPCRARFAARFWGPIHGPNAHHNTTAKSYSTHRITSPERNLTSPESKLAQRAHSFGEQGNSRRPRDHAAVLEKCQGISVQRRDQLRHTLGSPQ